MFPGLESRVLVPVGTISKNDACGFYVKKLDSWTVEPWVLHKLVGVLNPLTVHKSCFLDPSLKDKNWQAMNNEIKGLWTQQKNVPSGYLT